MSMPRRLLLRKDNMPQVTVYIREEDIELWKAVEKKSEFIHSALRGQPKVSPPLHKKSPKKKLEDVYEATVDITRTTAFTTDPSKSENQLRLCKNGHILSDLTGRCTQKDCKYS